MLVDIEYQSKELVRLKTLGNSAALASEKRGSHGRSSGVLTKYGAEICINLDAVIKAAFAQEGEKEAEEAVA